jgi:hypothetical protein
MIILFETYNRYNEEFHPKPKEYFIFKIKKHIFIVKLYTKIEHYPRQIICSSHNITDQIKAKLIYNIIENIFSFPMFKGYENCELLWRGFDKKEVEQKYLLFYKSEKYNI